MNTYYLCENGENSCIVSLNEPASGSVSELNAPDALRDILFPDGMNSRTIPVSAPAFRKLVSTNDYKDLQRVIDHSVFA